jgi:hypothetical protein
MPAYDHRLPMSDLITKSSTTVPRPVGINHPSVTRAGVMSGGGPPGTGVSRQPPARLPPGARCRLDWTGTAQLWCPAVGHRQCGRNRRRNRADATQAPCPITELAEKSMCAEEEGRSRCGWSGNIGMLAGGRSTSRPKPAPSRRMLPLSRNQARPGRTPQDGNG